jgi:hypothetical protein
LGTRRDAGLHIGRRRRTRSAINDPLPTAARSDVEVIFAALELDIALEVRNDLIRGIFPVVIDGRPDPKRGIGVRGVNALERGLTIERCEGDPDVDSSSVNNRPNAESGPVIFYI